MAKYWKNIESHINDSSSLSISTPTVDPSANRALIFKNNYDEMEAERLQRSVGARFVLRTDFSRYYKTIYTHSIPWALHGKSIAKASIGKPSLLGNRIDKQVRNTMGSQTIGIPIGPDSSFLISEIIGVSVDKQLQSRVPRIKGIRHVDDYFLYFRDSSEAEIALNVLNSIAYYYELELNPNKTAILEMPESIAPPWVTDLRLHTFREGRTSQRTDLVSYFSKAFKYAKEFQNNYVLKYAIARIKELTVAKDNWSVYHSFLLQSIVADPNVIPTVLEILLAYSRLGYQGFKNRTSRVINELILYHARFNNAFELAWLLWLCKQLKIRVRSEAVRQLGTIGDVSAALVALDLRGAGLIRSKLDVSRWGALLNPSELYDDHWMLAYEADLKGWLVSSLSPGFVSSDDFFSELKKRGVSFYDDTIKTSPGELKSPGEVSSTKLSYGYVGGY